MDQCDGERASGDGGIRRPLDLSVIFWGAMLATIANNGKSLCLSMRLQKIPVQDYLLFWADEHTHFNYAMQWFLA